MDTGGLIMTETIRRFCVEYCKTGGNGSEAYRRAIAPKTIKEPKRASTRLLNNKEVINYINKLKDEQFNRDVIEVSYVIENLRKIVDTGVLTKTVYPPARESHRGAKSHQVMIDSYGANSALKTLSTFCPQSKNRKEIGLKSAQVFKIGDQEISFE